MSGNLTPTEMWVQQKFLLLTATKTPEIVEIPHGSVVRIRVSRMWNILVKIQRSCVLTSIRIRSYGCVIFQVLLFSIINSSEKRIKRWTEHFSLLHVQNTLQACPALDKLQHLKFHPCQSQVSMDHYSLTSIFTCYQIRHSGQLTRQMTNQNVYSVCKEN